MHIKPIVKPTINESFFYGDIISWELSQSIMKDTGKYFYKIKLYFSSGKAVMIRKTGFIKKKDAAKSRDNTASQLGERTFIPFSYKVKEFYDFWLYYHMIDNVHIAYGTFMSYRNIIYNYILPVMADRKLESIERKDLIDLLAQFKSSSLVKSAYCVILGSFRYAKEHAFICVDPSASAVSFDKRVRKKERQDSIKKGESCKKSSFTIPDPSEIAKLLLCCQKEYPQMFMPLLLAFTTGLRISETLALKYDDIDYTNKILHVSRQIGRKITNDGIYDGTGSVQECRTKTEGSVRSVPLPDFVIEEVVLSRARYEKHRKRCHYFNDLGYICYRDDGYPFHRSSFNSSFNSLLGECDVQKFRWHDIRHIYATVLKNNSVSLKAISSALGHTRMDTTENVYIEKRNDIADCSKYLQEFIDDILPSYDTGNIGQKSKFVIPNDYILDITSEIN